MMLLGVLGAVGVTDAQAPSRQNVINELEAGGGSPSASGDAAAETAQLELPAKGALKSPKPSMAATCPETAEEWPLGAPRQELEEGLRRAEAASDHGRAANFLVLLADDALTRGDLPQALDNLRAAASRFAIVGDDSSRLSILLRRGLLAHQLGHLRIAEEDLRLAITLADRELASRRGCEEPADWMRRLILDLGRFDESSLDDEAVAAAQQALARLYLGQFLQEFRRPDEAIGMLELVLEASPRIGVQLQARVYFLLGSIAMERRDHRKARTYFDQAELSLGVEPCAQPRAAFPETCFELFSAAAELAALEGDRSTALALSAKAEDAARGLGDPIQELYVLAKRCSLVAKSERDHLVAIWKQGEEILAQVSESPQYFVGLTHVATMAMCAGLTERALALTLQAKQQLPEHVTEEFAHLLAMMQRVLEFGSGAPETSDSIERTLDSPTSVRMTEIRKLLQTLGVAAQWESGPVDEADIEALIAGLPADAPMVIRTREALKQLELSATVEDLLKAFEALVAGDRGEAAEQIREIANALRELHNTGEASGLLGPLGKLVSNCLVWGSTSSQNLAGIYRDILLTTPDLDSGLELAQQRVEAGERCLQAAHLDETFLRHAEHSRLDFEVLATLQARKGLFEEAFATAERARAFSLMRWLGRSRPTLQDVVDPNLYDELERSKTKIQSMEEELAETASSESAPLRADLRTARKHYDDLLLSLKLTTRGYTELAAMELADIESIQQHLDPQSVLISYFTMAEQTLAWVIERESWRVVQIPVERDALAADVRQLKRRLSSSRSAVVQEPPASRGAEHILGTVDEKGRALSVKLYESLIGSLELNRDEKRLLIVAHDALQQLSFAALSESANGPYLVEHHAVSMLPSASAITVWDSESSGDSGGGKLVLGDPRTDVTSLGRLPYAQREAELVAKLLGVPAWVGKEARESLVRQEASMLSMLLIAAHGVQSAEDPRRSFLALANGSVTSGTGPEHDGRLEMGEVFDEIRFANQPLVVLSACETGLGQRAGGDEIQGFIRAFLFAGAGSVAATLWKVDDAASFKLMQKFFTYLEAGIPAAEALQEAQKEMLRGSRFVAPYYWAGFSITGNPLIQLRPSADSAGRKRF